jgi:hypothetical protein
MIEIKWEPDYYVTYGDGKGWHVIKDEDAGWEFDRFEGNSKWLKKSSGLILFGPFFSNHDSEEGPIGSGKVLADGFWRAMSMMLPKQ